MICLQRCLPLIPIPFYEQLRVRARRTLQCRERRGVEGLRVGRSKEGAPTSNTSSSLLVRRRQLNSSFQIVFLSNPTTLCQTLKSILYYELIVSAAIDDDLYQSRRTAAVILCSRQFPKTPTVIEENTSCCSCTKCPNSILVLQATSLGKEKPRMEISVNPQRRRHLLM